MSAALYRTKCSCINLDYFMQMHLVIPQPYAKLCKNLKREGKPMKLYYSPGACSLSPHIALLEAGLTYTNGELHKNMGPQFSPVLSDDAKAFFKDRTMGKFKYVDGELAGKDYLMGKQFTVADGYMFTMLSWAERMKWDLASLSNL